YTITYYDTTLYLFHFSFGLRPPISTLFPYTTLFRSRDRGRSGRPARAPPAGRARDRVREPGSRPRTVPGDAAPRPRLRRRAAERSEEHTSELQSRENLVCRLLLEKKKRMNKTIHSIK